MEKKVVIYIYTEHSNEKDFNDNFRPFLKTDIARELRSLNYSIFKETGGITALDYFKDSRTHVRISVWDSADGYHRWKTHPDTQRYLKIREDYYKTNHVTQSLEGPFETIQF